MNIISAVNVKKRVENPGNPIDILKGVDLFVNEGESVAILGASGSGKTTLLSLLAGLDVPSSGEIYLDKELISSFSEEQRARIRLAKTGFIFQSFDLLPHFNARENVMLPLLLLKKEAAKAIAADLLNQVGLAARHQHFPRQLSGGEQQRVAIARAFSTCPKILFADEPTGNLDNETGNKIIELLFTMNQKEKTTLVMVTHDPALSKQCDRILKLVEGKITEDVDLTSDHDPAGKRGNGV